MKVIAVCSHKGGVGKTTLSLNLGLSLARRGHRTLIVDLDPQGAIGLSLGRDRWGYGGLAEVLAGRLAPEDALVRTRMDTLQLLPIGRMQMRQSALFDRHMESGEKLGAVLDALRDRFDMVVVDTPAGFGGATMGALRNATHMISPLAAEPLAMRGAPEVLELAVWLRELELPVELLGFVVTMVNYDDPQSVAVLNEARQRFGSEWLLETVIRRDPSFLEASAAGVPLSLLRRQPPLVAAAFDQLAQELEIRMNREPAQVDDHEPVSLID